MLILSDEYGYGFSRGRDPDTGKTVGFYRGAGPGMPANVIEKLHFDTQEWEPLVFVRRIKLNWDDRSVDNSSWSLLPGESPVDAFIRIYETKARERFAEAYELVKMVDQVKQKLKELTA